MKTTQQRLEQIKSTGYDLDFGNVFNHTVEIYKKSALMSGLAILVFAIVLGGLAVGVISGFVGLESYMQFTTGMTTGGFTLVQTLIYIASMCVISGLTNPFSASLIWMAMRADRGESISVGDAFHCYKPEYFGALFVEAIIVSVVSVGISQGLAYAFPLNTTIGLLGTFISLTVALLTIMAVPLIIFGKLGAMEAISGSITLVSKNLFVIIGLLVVSFIVSCVGIIGFCIGIFFTIPFMPATYYAIYKQAMGVEETHEIDEIGSPDTF